MFPVASLTTFLLLVVSVATNPIVVRKSPVSLSLARHFNISGVHDLVKKDQARAKSLVYFGKAKRGGTFSDGPGVSVDVTNVTNEAIYYTANISVGDPPTFCGCRCFISCLDSETRL
jgi:cathepsin E